ncbi:hypothetical protein ACJVDH_20425 [Pedobacter sp. AW1-32]|uniref:hypothetical protein n=1 Tax=Pedobacter sp. AW1-32 TaxID=3383026 RepID=UPI003FEEEBD2
MKGLFLGLALLFPSILIAQTIKTDLLILGNGNSAFAAGIQAAESGVKALVLTQKDGFDIHELEKINDNGILKAFEKQARKSLKIADSVSLPEMNKQRINAILSDWSDSSKLFKVINNLPFTELKRSGSGWELRLSKDRKIRAKALIFAAAQSAQFLSSLELADLKPIKKTSVDYKNNIYRTSVGAFSGTASVVSLYDLFIPAQENLLYIDPVDFQIGQSAGAVAAYSAFFKVKISEVNLKRVQGELLSFKSSLFPIEDIRPIDSNWLAIQKICLTGVLKCEEKSQNLFFNPDLPVNYAEIKQPIKDYYYKAQIWFDDHQDVPINLENAISMVCYVGNKSVEATKTELEKKWQKAYKFHSVFDLKKTLTRREFAVIANEYLKPFDIVNVDKTGKVLR